jgi:plastocyanin
MRRTYWTGVIVLFSLAGCSDSTTSYGGGDDGGGGGSSTTITVGNDFFTPTPNTVPPGTVTFTWATPSNGHTIVWDSGPGTLPANTQLITSGSRTVTLQTGVYEYHCSIHGAPGSGMHGRIIVQ